MAQLDDQLHDALTQAIKGGYSMDETLNAMHDAMVQSGARPEWARSKLAKYGYTPPAPQAQPDTALGESGLGGLASAAGNIFSDPLHNFGPAISNMILGQAQESSDYLNKAKENLIKGIHAPTFREGVGQGLDMLRNVVGAVPMVGHPLVHGAQNVAEGNTPAALGDAFSLAMMGGGKALAESDFIKNPNAYKPEVGMNKALVPSEGNSGFLDNVHDVGGRIKQAAGRSASNVTELIDDAQKGANSARQALEPYFQRAENSGLVGLRGDAVVQATQKALDKVLTKPSEAQLKSAIMDETRGDFGRELNLREWKQHLENINKQEFSFYNKTDEAQRAALGKAQDAVRKAQRDAMSDMLYKALSPEDGGLGPRQIQKSLSGMLDMMDAAKNRRLAIGREESESNLAQTRRIVNAGLHATAVPLRAVFSDNAVEDIGQAWSSSGKSNTLIRRSMKSIPAETKPYPQPLSPVHPNAPQAAPPPGSAVAGRPAPGPPPPPGPQMPPAGLPQGIPPQLAAIVQSLIRGGQRP